MAYTLIESDLPWSSTGTMSMAYGNGRFVVVRGFGTDVATSDDNGVSWTLRSAPFTLYAYGMVYGNGVFVATTGGPTIYVSPDGVSWSSATIPVSAAYYAIAFGNGRFVVLSSNGKTAWSTDGETWIAGGSITPTSGWTYVGYNGTNFTTNHNTQFNTIWKSADGDTWTSTVYTPFISSSSAYSTGNGLSLFTNYSRIVAANGDLSSVISYSFAEGYTDRISPTLYFDNQYVTLVRNDDGTPARFRRTTNIVDATFEELSKAYIPPGITTDAPWRVAVGDSAVLFLVNDTSAGSIVKVVGYSAEPTPVVPTQFWENLIGTSQS